ncbi:MAG: polyprenyl synthetase family protein [Opitutales bacterium]|nr:polyprenyl synthetase family protein [Opitutales bacterium]
MTESFDLSQWMAESVREVESALDRCLPPAGTRPSLIHEAMRYSLNAGGKRLRPLLLIAAGTAFGDFAGTGISRERLDFLPAAVAVECLHTYSLIHDDLPCMDNADLRRGKPTCHKVYGETIALLAGDALLTHALTLPTIAYAEHPAVAARLTRILGTAADSQRMIGGQVEDTLGEKEEMTPERLAYIHQNKTAALISAALLMGATLADLPEPLRERVENLLCEFGFCVGVAFQIIDDILDETADENTLGKPVRADEDNKKTTYPKLYGMSKAKEDAGALTERALKICDELDGLGGNAKILRELARHLLRRTF